MAHRIHLQTNDAAGHEDEGLIGLEPGDCAEGGGAVFEVTATGEGTLAVGKVP